MTPSTEVRVDADLFRLVVEAAPNAMLMIERINLPQVRCSCRRSAAVADATT